jgi:hypothetical protein
MLELHVLIMKKVGTERNVGLALDILSLVWPNYVAGRNARISGGFSTL